MKKLSLLLMLLSWSILSNAQLCTYEYIDNGTIPGSSGNLASGTPPGWFKYSGTPKISSSDNTGTPIGTGSVYLFEKNSNSSATGAFNVLTKPLLSGHTYVLSFAHYVRSNEQYGKLNIVLVNSNSTLTENGNWLTPSTEVTNIVNNNGYLVGSISSFGTMDQWANYTLPPFPIPSGMGSFNQILFIPEENNSSSSAAFAIRLDDISLKNQNSLSLSTSIKTDQVCPGSCDGAIEVFGYYGTPPYSYTYTGADPSNNGSGTLNTLSNTNGTNPASSILSELCPDTYSITITDANGCSRTTNNQIINPSTCLPSGSPLNDVYTGGTSFSGDFFATKDVHFYDGVYTINSGSRWEMMSCDIQYDSEGTPIPSSYRKIYIHDKAELIIEDATVTGFCNNVWSGIVLDHSTARLKIQDKGRIEHAYRGVSGTGERIDLEEADFVNNLNAISNCYVQSNSITNSTFSSDEFAMPYPYNNGQYFMENAIEIYAQDVSTIEKNTIDNVKKGIEVWISGTNTLNDNTLLNVRKYGLLVRNQTSNLISAENNSIELNANLYSPSNTLTDVTGIYQLNMGLPAAFNLNVRFYKNRIERTPSSSGLNLIGIHDICRGVDDGSFYEENTILLGGANTTVGIRSNRDQNYGWVTIKKNHISQGDIGLELGNTSTYSGTSYNVQCNIFSTLNWGIVTRAAVSGSQDVTRLEIGAYKAPASNYWVNIPTNQYLKNNSLHTLIYWKSQTELIDSPTNTYFPSSGGYSIPRGLFSTGAICQ